MTAPSFGNTFEYGDNDILDDNDAVPSSWTTIDPVEDFLGNEPLDDPTVEILKESPIDPSVVNPRERSKEAKAYEKEVKGVLRTGFQVLVGNPKTLPDAAVILQYGPAFSIAVGDLAAENKWVAGAVDFLTDTTENAALSLLAVAVPMTLQILRNHEPTAEVPTGRVFRIGKREFRIRVKIKLPGRIRLFTREPKEYAAEVFSDPDVQRALAKRGLKIVPR